ncbi:hypothetical protein D3C71_1897760 [compost metagenome]
MDAIDQDASSSWGAHAYLPSGEGGGVAGHPDRADRDLHPDQPAHRGVDDLHVLQRHPPGDSGGGQAGWGDPGAGDAARAAAHQQGWAGLDHAALDDPVLERGLLVAQPDELQRRTSDRADRFLLEP